MATMPKFIVTQHSLETEADLQHEMSLPIGTTLELVSKDETLLLLRPVSKSLSELSPAQRLSVWSGLGELLPSARTESWKQWAEARKQLAAKLLNETYTSGVADASQMKRVEREWELADDELDFGPLQR